MFFGTFERFDEVGLLLLLLSVEGGYLLRVLGTDAFLPETISWPSLLTLSLFDFWVFLFSLSPFDF